MRPRSWSPLCAWAAALLLTVVVLPGSAAAAPRAVTSASGVQPVSSVAATAPPTGSADVPGSLYVPTAPRRVLDTRIGLGAPQAMIAARSSVRLPRPASVPEGATAVVLNVTVTEPGASGFVTVGPEQSFSSSNLNFDADQTVPNLVISKLADDGSVSLTNGSYRPVHLVADLQGSYAHDPLGSSYVPLPNARVLDTRTGLGAAQAAVPPRSAVRLARSGLVPEAATAVVLNVTVTQPRGIGFVGAGPGPSFATSNLNFGPSQTVPNLVVSKADSDGSVWLTNGSWETVHLVADLQGYFMPGASESSYVPYQPQRVLDSRIGLGAVLVPARGAVKLARPGSVPAWATAVVLNVTVTEPGDRGFVTVGPEQDHSSSNLNFVPGQTVPNLVTSRVTADGAVWLTNGSWEPLHLVADLQGAYVPRLSNVTRSPLGMVGLRYDHPLEATGGVTPYTWSLSGGARPAGLDVDAATGVISGTPSEASSSTFVTRVIDRDGATASREETLEIRAAAPVPTAAARLAAGQSHTCAVENDRTARCWGSNSFGQLGDGTTTPRSTPAPVSGVTGAVAVAAGSSHTCALLGDGTVRCWGKNDDGQLGDGTTTARSTPVAVPGLRGVTALTAGLTHSCALLIDRSARCWGDNSVGQLGDGTTWERSTTVAVGGLSDVVSLSSSSLHTCALLANGTGRCWGWNGNGQLGDGTRVDRPAPVSVVDLTDAVSVATGGSHSCAVLSDGTGWCWGRGQGAIGDGTLSLRTAPVPVVDLAGAMAVALGSRHSCALLSDRTARCWGNNERGQVGDGTTTIRSTSVPVAELSGAVALAVGGDHTCALLATGSVRCWGRNDAGQVGDGTTTNRSTPVPVVGSP